MEQKKKLDEILKAVGGEYGFCRFDRLKDGLLPCRAAERLPKEPKTVICFAFPYLVESKPPENISRYAAVPDYHAVCGERLSRAADELADSFGFAFSPFCDNSPIPEVAAAALCGLGAIGNNGLLITKNHGSYVFLGEIVTDMPIDSPYRKPQTCRNCGACERACPVGLDKTRCISALTQKKRPTERDTAAIAAQKSVWGCDICQEVCPENRLACPTDIKEFITGYRPRYVTGEDPAGRAYLWRGEKIIERNAGIVKNAGNTRSEEAKI